MRVWFCSNRMRWELLLNYLIVLHREVGIYLQQKFSCPIRNRPSIQEGNYIDIIRAHIVFYCVLLYSLASIIRSVFIEFYWARSSFVMAIWIILVFIITLKQCCIVGNVMLHGTFLKILMWETLNIVYFTSVCLIWLRLHLMCKSLVLFGYYHAKI